jgi:hypothetical protein
MANLGYFGEGCCRVRASRKSPSLQSLAPSQHYLTIESVAHLGERAASPYGRFDPVLADLGLTK